MNEERALALAASCAHPVVVLDSERRVVAASDAADAQQSEIGKHKHLGVAACASSVCHGKIAPQPGRNVGLDEYKTWSQEDVHARAYLTLEPGLERYLTTGHHDDERGVIATYLYTLDRPTRQWLWVHFLVNTPTIVATVDAALAAAMVVLGLQAAEAPRAVAVAGGVAAFLLVWGTLFRLQLHTLRPLRHETPRFPTPPDRP